MYLNKSVNYLKAYSIITKKTTPVFKPNSILSTRKHEYSSRRLFIVFSCIFSPSSTNPHDSNNQKGRRPKVMTDSFKGRITARTTTLQQQSSNRPFQQNLYDVNYYYASVPYLEPLFSFVKHDT